MRQCSPAPSTFRIRLAQTIAWCLPRARAAEPERSLRSHDLKPESGTERWPDLVNSVCARRAQLIGSTVPSFASLAGSGGRLLAFDPGQSLSDAAAWQKSGGFFDPDNVPPWDTWVTYICLPAQRSDRWTHLDAAILCWIPPVFVPLVESSIAVNAERCIEWADQLQEPLLRRLQASGLAI